MHRIVISEKIVQYRKRHGLSQKQLAKALGVTPQAVSKWEHGHSYPDITLLPLLAEYLGCSVADFFNKAEEKGHLPS